MSTTSKPATGSPLAGAVVGSPEGIVVTQMLIVADIERSVAFYRDVLGAIVEREHPPAMLRLHNSWLVINVGGGPTEDKPEVTVTPPTDPNVISSFLNIRVADIEATYRRWSERGATFITEPMERGPEIRCYLRDPDGYLIELGQTTAPVPTPPNAVSRSAVQIRALSSVEALADLEPLWLALHEHHRAVSSSERLVDDDVASWARRRATYESWMRAGTAIVLVADIPSAQAAGYLVAHIGEGPDDTFAVGDRYLELYSLSVTATHRGQGIGTALLDALDRRLEALGIHDVTVAVMVGNDDALRLYQARGLEPAEIVLWHQRATTPNPSRPAISRSPVADELSRHEGS